MTFGTLVNVSQSQKLDSKNIKNKIYFMKLVKSDPHGDANLIINFISPKRYFKSYLHYPHLNFVIFYLPFRPFLKMQRLLTMRTTEPEKVFMMLPNISARLANHSSPEVRFGSRWEIELNPVD